MAPGSERRRSPRVRFTAPAAVDWGGVRVEAYSEDLSATGVGLICDGPLPIGAPVRLTFRLGGGPGAGAQVVAGRVARSRVGDDATLVGVEFAAPLAGGSALARAAGLPGA